MTPSPLPVLWDGKAQISWREEQLWDVLYENPSQMHFNYNTQTF